MLPPDDGAAEREDESPFGASEGVIRSWPLVLAIWAAVAGVLALLVW